MERQRGREGERERGRVGREKNTNRESLTPRGSSVKDVLYG